MRFIERCKNAPRLERRGGLGSARAGVPGAGRLRDVARARAAGCTEPIASAAGARPGTQTGTTSVLPLALEAIRRAEAFDRVAHLPRPWTFSEVFLFDDDRRFTPRTLDF